MTRKVVVTVNPIYREAVEGLCRELRHAGFDPYYLGEPDEQLDAERLLRLLDESEIYVVGNAKVPRRVIEGSPRLALICKYRVGVDNVDLAAASGPGVWVTNAPGCNAISVAEMTIGLMIALRRRLKELEAAVHSGAWRVLAGSDLSGSTLGVVGLGNIGKQVAIRARAFGMRVLANDLLEFPDFCREFTVEPAGLGQLLSESDIITLHVPLTPQTRHMIGADQLAGMRRGAILIHTARGGVVEEAALHRALVSKHLAGAAVDVFEREPLGESPLRSLENVILTPHVAGITYQSAERIARRTLANVLAYRDGGAPADLVNPNARRP